MNRQKHFVKKCLNEARGWLQVNRTFLAEQARLWTGRLVIWFFGCLAGAVAVAFAFATDEITFLFIGATQKHPWLPFVLTPPIGAALLWITRNFFQGAEGGGIPQVIAEIGPRPDEMPWRPLISLRIAFGKILISLATVGIGYSFGRQGPSVQIGACIMASAERFVPAGLYVQRSHLLVAGGAAGIAAAFNAPLAGIVFAIEELSRSIESRMSGVVITAIILAGVVAHVSLGSGNFFDQIPRFGESPQLAIAVLVCALLTGLAGGIFARTLLLSASGWKGRLADFRSRHPYRFALFCGLLIAAIGWSSGGLTWCGGYVETRMLLWSDTALPWHFAPAKFIATIVSYLSGLPGGMLAPSLAIGAGIGQSLSPLLSDYAFSTTVIVLCMVGFLAAVTQAPITSFVIVMEMVNGYPIVIGLMATALIASTISRTLSPPLYSTLAEQMLKAQGHEKKADGANPNTTRQPS
ncbi:MAG: H(+)/Cl(-) exchange transporter ClcA [Betaproteobacteria bacterium ADurb.Bin341]|nr:MAG: H(+)/Cl(-) exchange transporter ClcA [Betaproteobacteria bacterium ADurb.Bin341]